MSEMDTVEVDEETLKLEKEARQFGWVPKEEFRGSDDVWVDAESFVQRGKEINPILRKNNERLMKELDSTKRQMADFKEAAEEFKRFQKESYERKATELQSELALLKEQKKDAINSGDGQLAVDLDDQMDALKERQQEERKKALVPERKVEPEVTEEVTEWVEANEWYSKDLKMRSAADAVAVQLNKEQPWLKGKAFFEALDTELTSTFAAEKLGKRVRPRSPVDSSSVSTSRSSGSGKSYSSLPSDAKAACDKFVRQGLMTKEEYVASYEW